MGNIGPTSRHFDVLPVGRLILEQPAGCSLPAVGHVEAGTEPSPTVPAPEPMPAPYPEPVPEPAPEPHTAALSR